MKRRKKKNLNLKEKENFQEFKEKAVFQYHQILIALIDR